MFARETPILNAKSSEPAKIGQILAVLRSGVSGFKKFRFLLQKAHLCVNPRRLSHFLSKSVTGCPGVTSTSVREKSKKVTDSHRKDMSPLTQGLNYRSACDVHASGRLSTHVPRVVPRAPSRDAAGTYMRNMSTALLF